MKKSISLTLAMLMTMSFFVGCEEEAAPEAHEHAFATEWSSDATKHWHAATCDDEDDCKTAMKDVDGHVDANKDGACDVCAYVVCAHEYATEWSSDATNHWYAATCGCDVKKDEAAHTANAAGVACSVCGAAMTPDVSDVAKAIAVGVAQGDEVAYGKITNVTDSEYYDNPVYAEVSYEVAENYAHVTTAESVCAYSYDVWDYVWTTTVYDCYFTAFGEENVFAIQKATNGEYTLINEEFTQDIAEGYLFAGFLGYGETEKFYGVENLVSGLYALGADFANNEMTASVEDGVYTFAFEFVDEFDYIYDVEVAFTLGENYNFENVAVKSDRYVAETTGEGEDMVYSIPAETEPSYVYTYEIAQVCGDNIVPAPFDVEEVLITGITFKEVANNTVNLTTGTMTKVYVDEIQPATAVFELNAHEITVVDADGNEAYAYVGFSGDSEGIYMYATVYAAGEYTLTLANAVTEVELSLVVTNPEVDAVWAEIGGTATTAATVYTGAKVEMEVKATEYANQGYTATLAAATGSSATLTTDGQWVSFTPDVEGEYVVTIKSAEDETITSTVTITAEEAPDITEVLSGTWSGNDVNGQPASVVFTPDATPATGYTASGSAVVNYMKYDNMAGGFAPVSYNVTYTYNVTDGFVVTVADGSQHNYNLALTSNFSVELTNMYHNFTMASLTQETSGGSTATALDLTGTALFDSVNGLYIVFANATQGQVVDSIEMGSETIVWLFDYSATSEEITFSNWMEVSDGNLMPTFTGYNIYMDGENVAAVALAYTHPMNGMSVNYTFEAMA